MAITRLLRIKETSGRNKATHLKKNIFYILKPQKTENGMWVGGNAGTTPEGIYRAMKQNKKLWNKEHGSQAFHYMLSFPPDSGVDEALAFQITQEFCQELLDENYLHVFAVHNDKKHMHTHITFDSVSRIDGRKFHSPKGDWEKRIQPVTDKLCEKYHLSTLFYDPEAKVGKNYQAWESEKENEKREQHHEEQIPEPRKYSSYDIIRDDVDQAIAASDTYEQFLEYLQKIQHYEIRDGKYLSLKPPGRDKAIRTNQLGMGYEKEKIQYRIAHKENARIPNVPEKIYGSDADVRSCIRLKVQRRIRTYRMTSYQKLYYKRWRFTCFIRKPWFTDTWRYKQDILKVEDYSRQLCYMIEQDITDAEHLEGKIVKLQNAIEETGVLLDAAKTKLFYSKVNQAIRKIEKNRNMLNDFPEGSRKDLEEENRQLKQYVEEETGQPYEGAEALYQEAVENYEFYKKKMQEFKKEQKLCKRIAETNFRDYRLDEKWLQNRYRELDQERGITDRTRITLNEKLFEILPETDQIKTRIPYKRKYIVFPASECKLINNRHVLSAWIEHGKEYCIIDADGKIIRNVRGGELKAYYDDKTDERGIKKNMNKELIR